LYKNLRIRSLKDERSKMLLNSCSLKVSGHKRGVEEENRYFSYFNQL
jgi:hypothetical protein